MQFEKTDIEIKLDHILKDLSDLKRVIIRKQKPFLDLHEASIYTNIPKGTLYQYTSKRKLPFYKLQDRKIYFAINDLNEFILNRNNKRP